MGRPWAVKLQSGYSDWLQLSPPNRGLPVERLGLGTQITWM